jgi:hypothetical protein
VLNLNYSLAMQPESSQKSSPKSAHTSGESASESAHDRRRQPRFRSDLLVAHVRLKGQFNRVPVEVLDFNRHGLAVRIEQPLPKDQLVFLTLDTDQISVSRVIGVVHNCLPHSSGYRCGIRFRTQSGLQFDREKVELQLAELEQHLAADD